MSSQIQSSSKTNSNTIYINILNQLYGKELGQ